MCTLVNAFLYDLNRVLKARVEALVDGLDDSVVTLPSGYELKLGRDECVKADVQGVETGVLQRLQFPVLRMQDLTLWSLELESVMVPR